jgi:hypothetical protein
MHRTLTFLLVLIPLASAAAQAPPKEPIATATAFLDVLAKGDFQAATQGFTETMKTALPAEKLAEDSRDDRDDRDVSEECREDRDVPVLVVPDVPAVPFRDPCHARFY